MGLKTQHVVVAFVLAAVILLTSTAAAATGSALASSRKVTVLALGWDEPISHAVAELKTLIPFAELRTVISISGLLAASSRADGIILIVGHGLPEGILLSGQLVAWELVADILRRAPAGTVLVAACYSMSLQPMLSDKRVFGFAGLVDVDEAAYVSAAFVYGYRGAPDRVEGILEDLVQIMVDKAFGVSSRPLWTLGYQTRLVRGIWHVLHSGAYGSQVEYTHPDTYIHYPWITAESSVSLGSISRNLVAGHIKKSDLDNANLANGIVSLLVGGGIAGLVALSILTAGVAALIALLLAIVGFGIGWFIEYVVRDEARAGWEWVQNVWSQWYGAGFDMKIGDLWWSHYQVVFGFPQAWPLWYGGQDLGIDGY